MSSFCVVIVCLLWNDLLTDGYALMIIVILLNRVLYLVVILVKLRVLILRLNRQTR